MNNRRKFLGATCTSVTLPFWSKPIVNAVILPAHAQTSSTATSSMSTTNVVQGEENTLDTENSEVLGEDDEVDDSFGVLSDSTIRIVEFKPKPDSGK